MNSETYKVPKILNTRSCVPVSGLYIKSHSMFMFRKGHLTLVDRALLVLVIVGFLQRTQGRERSTSRGRVSNKIDEVTREAFPL